MNVDLRYNKLTIAHEIFLYMALHKDVHHYSLHRHNCKVAPSIDDCPSQVLFSPHLVLGFLFIRPILSLPCLDNIFVLP